EIETIRGGRQQIVITEIPFEVNKANLVKKMDEFRIERKVEGISEVRDETDRTGLRIV
ncbi:DNA gyrase subunit A, partial [Bacillus licheniformis]